jgi:3,4-dihydroxy-2-butanone 4-phosphate synthase
MAASSSSSSAAAVQNDENVTFDSIDDTVADIKAGKFVIVLDDENRENEGDLIISAQNITSKQMAWFIKHTRCVPIMM